MDQYRMIDGKDFSDFVSGFVAFIKKVCRYILTSTKEYFKTAILIFILAAGAGLLCWYNAKVFFEAEMVCTFTEMNKKTYGEMVHDLDRLASSHSYDALAKQLNIPLQESKRIISIEGKNMAGSMLFEDITQDKSPIYLDVKANTSNVFPLMEAALLNYLNTKSPYLITKGKNDSADVSTRLRQLNKNIAIADSVITTIYTYLKIFKPFSDTSITASKFASLIKYKNDMEEQQVLLKRRGEDIEMPVQILHGFVPPDQPSSDKSKILRLTLIVSIVSSCTFAVLQKALTGRRKLQSV